MECEHRWPFFVTNRGLQVWMCKKYQKSVNDDICSQCPDREGESPKGLEWPDDYPRREDEEIKAIYKVCQGCPLLKDDKTCQGMGPEFFQVDIIAQAPTARCPEGKW
ncbi:MAG: hypothetical protein ACYS7Y_34505 [Planctomycetota bacterium]